MVCYNSYLTLERVDGQYELSQAVDVALSLEYLVTLRNERFDFAYIGRSK